MEKLYENQNIPQELESYVRDNDSLHPYFEINFSGIKPKNYCGVISINNKSYFIAPKIADRESNNLDIFLYMLIYAYDIKLSNIDINSSSSSTHSIFEIFIRLFCDTLLNELKQGVFREYITMEDNLKVLRGKYLISKNFSNFHHQNIYCEFDEFSMDSELNRLFLYALRYLQKFSSYPNLYRCEAILDEVSYLNIDFRGIDIKFDRVNIRYKRSFDIAIMLLKRVVPMTNCTQDRSFVFLFDMSEVFEKFIGKLYKEIDSTTKLQTKGVFGNLHLKPDIVMSNRIIDTKYKMVRDRGDLSTQDKYQMFVYGVNFNIKDTLLLYPKHLKDIDENLELGRGENMVKLKMKSIDLDFDGEYSEFIYEIKRRLEEIK